MYDETRNYLSEGIEHLRYARTVAIRTGLVDELDRYGWAYGDPTEVGNLYEEVMSAQADALLRMLSGGEIRGEVMSGMFFSDDATDDYQMVVEEGNLDTRRLPLDTGSRGGVATVPEEGSYVVIAWGPRRLVSRFRGLLACLDREMAFFRIPGREDAHFVVYLPDAEFDPLHVTYGFFDKLVRAWEVLNGAGSLVARAG